MAASLLAPGRYLLDNVPRIIDVETMSDVLVAMGVDVRRTAPHQLTLDVPEELTPEAPYELVERMRASIVVLGPLLASCGVGRVAPPGGGDFGPRPIDMHLRRLAALGASLEGARRYIE